MPRLRHARHRAPQLGGDRLDREIEVGEAGCDDAVVGVGVEQRRAQTEVGDAIDQPAWQASRLISSSSTEEANLTPR